MSRQPQSEISEYQAQVLGIIRVLVMRNPDIPPTLEEIGKYLDSPRQAISLVVRQLERKGYITRGIGRYRFIKLTGKELTQKGRAA